MDLRAQDLATALKRYDEVAKQIEVAYTEDLKNARDTQSTKWRKSVDESIAIYNQATELNVKKYTDTIFLVEKNHQYNVDLAQKYFNDDSKLAADEYNKAVCAE